MIKRPIKRDEINMVVRSLQPKITRHLMGVPFIGLRSLVQLFFFFFMWKRAYVEDYGQTLLIPQMIRGRELLDRLLDYHPYTRSSKIPGNGGILTILSSSVNLALSFYEYSYYHHTTLILVSTSTNWYLIA